MTIIGLMGQKGSGKDAAASALVEDGFRRVAFADALKRVLYDTDPIVYYPHSEQIVSLAELVDTIGWDRAKNEVPEVRELLQKLGVAVREHVDKNAWVNAAFKGVDIDDDIVITDCRFLSEVERIRDGSLGVIVRVDRPGLPDGDGHVSEHEWRQVSPDYVVENDGTLEDLAGTIRLVAENERL